MFIINDLKRVSKNSLHVVDTLIIKDSFKIDLSNIRLKNSYTLKYLSDFNEPYPELINTDNFKYGREQRHLRQISGVLYLNRVHMEEERDEGWFDVAFKCGKFCGSSHRIYVKLEDSKWVIEKIESTTEVS